MLHSNFRKPSRNGNPSRPDPEVEPKAKRRTFTTEYKLRILAEADECTAQGQLGALLRREALYSSHLTTWRRQRASGGTCCQETGPQARRTGGREYQATPRERASAQAAGSG
jgi:transposase